MPGLTNPTMQTVAERLRTFAEGHLEIQAVFIFGSLPAGTLHEHSDVDVAVFLQNDADNIKYVELSLAYCVELEDRLNSPVDVVILNSASPMLRSQVFRKGKMVYTTDLNRTRRFIGDAMVEFYDEILVLEKMQSRTIRRIIGR